MLHHLLQRPASAPDSAPGLDAGTITFTGLTQPMVLQPVDQGAAGFVYTSGLSQEHPKILGGQGTVGLAITGGAHVPPASTGAAVPAPIFVSQPQANGTVDKDNPLKVVWNAGNGTHVRIDLWVFDGADEEQLKGNTITCTVEGDTGQYTIPSNVMGQLPGGGDQGFPDFNFDYVVYGVSRITLGEAQLPNGYGSMSLVLTRSGGGYAKLKD